VARERFVLDTSALLTLIEDQPGADRVEAILAREQVLIPSVALLEVYYITLQENGQDVANMRHSLLLDLDTDIGRELDDALIMTAGRFKAARALSLADAMVAAWASTGQATLVHKDPEFEQLAGELSLEALPYKKSTRRR
jgi:predicted nucleic acid-binding protein